MKKKLKSVKEKKRIIDLRLFSSIYIRIDTRKGVHRFIETYKLNTAFMSLISLLFTLKHYFHVHFFVNSKLGRNTTRSLDMWKFACFLHKYTELT